MRKQWLFGIFAVLLVVNIWAVAYSATATRPTKVFGGTQWLTGQSVTAGDLNADVDTLYGHINGANISDANIDATGITTRTKLPTEVVYDDEGNTMTGINTFDGGDANVFDTTLGSNHQASTACASGYTRTGLWCMRTEFPLFLNGSTIDMSSYTTEVVNASAKLAMLRVQAAIINDGSAGVTAATACTYPGDYTSPPACESTFGTGANVDGAAYSASEVDQSIDTMIIRTDSSGQIKWWCDVIGSHTSATCDWFIMGYMD